MSGWFGERRKDRSRHRSEEAEALFRSKYESFRNLLESNSELLEIISEIQTLLRGNTVFGFSFISASASRVVFHSARLVESLKRLSGGRYNALDTLQQELSRAIRDLVAISDCPAGETTLPFEHIRRDMAGLVGGKNANLGELAHLGLPVPRGFAITTSAFGAVLAERGLGDEIRRLFLGLDPENSREVVEACEDVQRRFLDTPLPGSVEEAILHAFDTLAASLGLPPSRLRVAVRSSAVGEDSELSFAGQYLSILNVGRDRLARSYSMVLASLFTPRAVAYHLYKGVSFAHTPMAAACLAMVDSAASGVMYSRNPVDERDDRVLINGLWGLGAYVVDGTLEPDRFTISRHPALGVAEQRVARKDRMLVCGPDGTVVETPVPEDRRDRPVLTEEQMLTLAGWAIELERHHGCPQDVEWTVGPRGELLLLQARPLGVELREEKPPVAVDGPPPLLSGGDTASPGIGGGVVHQVLRDDDLHDFPAGGVLVAPHSSPKLALVLPRAAAVVTEAGSVTGHMASVAREFHIPALLNVKGALAALPNGMEVTVDASGRCVHKGLLRERLQEPGRATPPMLGTPVMETLGRLAALVTPLNLTDPSSPSFRPENCRTVHDIMRFAHERSYTEMFRVNDLTSNLGSHAVKLKVPLPLDLYVLDLGGGIESGGRSSITPQEVLSTPFNALLRGMLREDLRFMEPRPIQIRGFLSIMARQMMEPPDAGGQRFGDRSYALVSDVYLNFSSRVGYHYSILDAYCGLTRNNNFVNFEFKGGAADDQRRNRRVRSIARILEALGFDVESRGDFVRARFLKREPRDVEDRLDQLGRLLLFTRQMDMLMHDETSVEGCARNFLEGRYDHC